MARIEAHVLLVGFMGSGKSTVAPWLAGALGCPCQELDQRIVERHQLSIPEIFERFGEAAFRRSEGWELSRLLLDPVSVIAMGGGAFHRRNRELLPADSHTVWLDIPVALAWRRCRDDSRRPLARDRRQFEALFRQRREDYRQARYRIPVHRQPPELLAREILAELQSESPLD